MKLTEHIRCVFDDAQAGKLEAALLHACILIDATGRRLYPSDIRVGSRFVRCIRDYYWLIEPMIGVGLDLKETRFENVTLPRLKTPPDFADVMFSIHRNSHAHGDEVPLSYELLKTEGPYHSQWEMSAEHLRMPDRVIWALTSVAVFCRKNWRFRGWGDGRYLSWADEKFLISDWWGREQEIKPIAVGWNTMRVKMTELKRLKEAADSSHEKLEAVVIITPPRSAA